MKNEEFEQISQLKAENDNNLEKAVVVFLGFTHAWAKCCGIPPFLAPTVKKLVAAFKKKEKADAAKTKGKK